MKDFTAGASAPTSPQAQRRANLMSDLQVEFQLFLKASIRKGVLNEAILRYRSETNPGWLALCEHAHREFPICVQALREGSLSAKLAECDRSVSRRSRDRSPKSARKWDAEIQSWISLLGREKRKLERVDGLPWLMALPSVTSAWLDIGAIHESFHYFADQNAKKVFSHTERAHIRVHELCYALERLMLFEHVWKV